MGNHAGFALMAGIAILSVLLILNQAQGKGGNA